MSFLSTPSLILRSSGSHDTLKTEPQSRTSNAQFVNSKSSLANLVQFARNPLENIGETVEDWYDGSTTEERVQKQAREDKKQLLYLKLRMVYIIISKRIR